MNDFDEWFQTTHSCNIRKIDDFYYCDTHTEQSSGPGDPCGFAIGDPLFESEDACAS